MKDDVLTVFDQGCFVTTVKTAVELHSILNLLSRKHVVCIETLKLLLRLLKEREILSADDISAIEKTFSDEGLLSMLEVKNEIQSNGMLEKINQATQEAEFDSIMRDDRNWKWEV